MKKIPVGLLDKFPNIRKSKPCSIEMCDGSYVVGYDVQGHKAYTLPPETGCFKDGWEIKAEIQADYYRWINDFTALKRNADTTYYSVVKGNFENEVTCSSLEALEDFLSNHMPEEWDYWDI